MLTRIDKVIVIIILLAALLSLPLAMSASSNSNSAYLSVFRAGKKIASYNLHVDKTIKIRGNQGGYCLLRISNGKASITKSTCPNKICMKMGPVQNSGQAIVCAPMTLLYKIESGQNNYLDAVNE